MTDYRRTGGTGEEDRTDESGQRRLNEDLSESREPERRQFGCREPESRQFGCRESESREPECRQAERQQYECRQAERRQGRRSFISGLLPGRSLLGPGLLVLLWTLLHWRLGSGLVPAPWAVLASFVRLFPRELLPHLALSLYRVAAAVLLSLLLAVPLGLWMGHSAAADAVLGSLAYWLYPVPKVAFLPLFMLLFGLGNTPKILLMVLVVFFQVLLAVRDGVKEIPEELFASVRSLGIEGPGLYWHLILPAGLPRLFSVLRMSIAVSLATLFFSENFASRYGIGYFIMNSWVMADYEQMFAGILAMSLMGILMFRLIDVLERHFCPWLTV